MTTIYSGPVINPQSLSSYLALPRCLIAVAADGDILWIDHDIDPANLRDTITHHGVQTYTLVHLKPGEFIMPGLVDTHIVRSPLPSPPLLISSQHACQFPNLGVCASLSPFPSCDISLDFSAEVTWNSSIGLPHIPFPPNPSSRTWTMPSAYIPTSSNASSRPA